MKRSLRNFAIMLIVWYVFGRLSAHAVEYVRSVDLDPISYFALRGLPLLSVAFFVLLLQVREILDLLVALVMWPVRVLLGRKQPEAPAEGERYSGRKYKFALVFVVTTLYAVAGLLLGYLSEGPHSGLVYAGVGLLWSLVVLFLLNRKILNLEEMMREE